MKLCMHKGPCGGARYYCLFWITPSYSSVFLWFTECPPSCYSIIFALYCTVCSFPTVTSFLQWIFYAYWQSCCVTTLTNCSSHREEPASICAWNQTHSLCTLRFSHEAVSQPQPMQACPNTGCGSLFGKRIGSFAANQCVKASSEFHCVWWLQSHILLLSTCFVFLFFRLLTLTGFPQGWLAWCVTIGLAIVGDDFSRNGDFVVWSLFSFTAVFLTLRHTVI